MVFQCLFQWVRLDIIYVSISFVMHNHDSLLHVKDLTSADENVSKKVFDVW